MCRYADFAGSTIDDGFDYTHGKDLWKEKLDYTNSWLSAHISDADAIGKPLIVEEFGKAVSAKKVYEGGLPHPLQAGAPSALLRQPAVCTMPCSWCFCRPNCLLRLVQVSALRGLVDGLGITMRHDIV